MNKRYLSPMIKSFSEESNEENDEQIIYHYTSTEGFLNIIKERQVRFTDILFLNDNMEKTYFLKVLLEFCQEYKESYPKFADAVERLLTKNEEGHIIVRDVPGLPYNPSRSFVFCASNEADSLHMWNYYVNNGKYQGYSIGIKPSLFLKTFETDSPEHINGFIVYYGNVIYEKRDQFAEITHLAKKIEQYIFPSDENSIKRQMIEIRLYSELQGVFFKDPAFKPEKEFRVLFSITNERIPRAEGAGEKYFGENNKKICEGFTTKQGLIVPYMSIQLPKDSVSRVYASPMIEYDLAKKSVKELLNAKGFLHGGNEVSIHRSKVPIRF